MPARGRCTSRIKRGKGILNTVVDHFLPIDVTLRGTRYCGPKEDKAALIKAGLPPLNKLDDACLRHSKRYIETSDDAARSQADRELQDAAWDRVKSSDSSLRERLNSLITAGLMKAKVMTGQGLNKRSRRRKTPASPRKSKPRILSISSLTKGGKLRVVHRRKTLVSKRKKATKRKSIVHLMTGGALRGAKRRKKRVLRGGAFYLRQFKKKSPYT